MLVKGLAVEHVCALSLKVFLSITMIAQSDLSNGNEVRLTFLLLQFFWKIGDYIK